MEDGGGESVKKKGLIEWDGAMVGFLQHGLAVYDKNCPLGQGWNRNFRVLLGTQVSMFALFEFLFYGNFIALNL